MSSQSFHAGQAHGKGSQQASDIAQSAQNKLGAAKDAVSDAAHNAQDNSGQAQMHRQENTEQAAGFLQQTGEQVKNMAQGAVDAVKNTLGSADNNSSGKR